MPDIKDLLPPPPWEGPPIPRILQQGKSRVETIIIPFRDAPSWVKTEWERLHGATKPEVTVHRTEVAEIYTQTFEYAVRDIVAYKAGHVMSEYVPAYESLLAVTARERSLYFGGAVKLKPDEAIAVMDYWGPRYQHIDLYIHPEAYELPRVLAPVLTDRQRKILASIRGYTSAYRREIFQRHEVTQVELDELQRMGLIDRRAAITTMGRNVIGDEQPW